MLQIATSKPLVAALQSHDDDLLDPMAVLSKAVTALLGPERGGKVKIRAAATEIIDFLRGCQVAALALIDPPRSHP